MSNSWDWSTAAREAGVDRDGRFNAGAMKLFDDAIVWQRSDGSVERFSAAQLERTISATAALLAELGVGRGDRVAGLMGRRPETFTVALACWRLGAIYVPLFSGFGGEALRLRLDDSEPRVVLVDGDNRAALADAQGSIPEAIVIAVDGALESEDGDLAQLLEHPRTAPAIVDTGLQDNAVLMYTSGTTGRPKGCEIPHRVLIGLLPFVRFCMNVRAGDLLFSGADAGWSFGLLTTGLAPMSEGVRRVIVEPKFDPRVWWESVARLQPTHFAAAPTAYRQLAAAGRELLPDSLPEMTSAGEPFDAPTFDWFKQSGPMVRDSYGLSEIGMVIAQQRVPPGPDPEPGIMGEALPGWEIELIDDDGNTVIGEGVGRIAVRDNGFFMSQGYWGRRAEWEARFADDWFLTEDTARRDEQGHLHYVGRADDMIVTAGYNVGPAEVEAALIDHPAIADAGCVAEPDARKGVVVSAHVVLAPGVEPPPDLLAELRGWVGDRVGWHCAPRHVEIHDSLPRTESGKLQRRLLRKTAV